jgi:CRP/FNR family transcriptional regulator, cyclic AMP receptor protein
LSPYSSYWADIYNPDIMIAMTTQPRFSNLTSLGDATPFVDRMREIIDRIKLFEDFDEGEIDIMARYMSCYHAPSGTEIIREGASGDFMILIIEGTVEITKLDSEGLPATVGMAGPGKTLGEMSLIDGEPRFASCLAIVDTLFAVLDRDGLTRIITEEPHIGIKLMMELLMLLNQRLRNVSSAYVKLIGGRKRFNV